MTKKTGFIISGILTFLGILILFLKLILKFNINIIDGFGGALLGMGIGTFLVTLFKRKNK